MKRNFQPKDYYDSPICFHRNYGECELNHEKCAYDNPRCVIPRDKFKKAEEEFQEKQRLQESKTGNKPWYNKNLPRESIYAYTYKDDREKKDKFLNASKEKEIKNNKPKKSLDKENPCIFYITTFKRCGCGMCKHNGGECCRFSGEDCTYYFSVRKYKQNAKLSNQSHVETIGYGYKSGYPSIIYVSHDKSLCLEFLHKRRRFDIITDRGLYIPKRIRVVYCEKCERYFTIESNVEEYCKMLTQTTFILIHDDFKKIYEPLTELYFYGYRVLDDDPYSPNRIPKLKSLISNDTCSVDHMVHIFCELVGRIKKIDFMNEIIVRYWNDIKTIL